MSTLQEIKKQRGLTNKALASQYGVSASVMGMILQGRHRATMQWSDIARLAALLGVTDVECDEAMTESYEAWKATWSKEEADVHD
jgi:transcriptional regulator with XRE-family HTH domain